MREICDENGIKVIVTHEPMEKILDDPEATIARQHAMGCPNTAFSGRAPDAAGYAKMAADMARQQLNPRVAPRVAE